jgi:hypothetical protein
MQQLAFGLTERSGWWWYSQCGEKGGRGFGDARQIGCAVWVGPDAVTDSEFERYGSDGEGQPVCLSAIGGDDRGR